MQKLKRCEQLDVLQTIELPTSQHAVAKCVIQNDQTDFVLKLAVFRIYRFFEKPID